MRALASYDILGFASFGLAYAFDSGRPLTRLFRNDVTGTYENYRARQGNPGASISDPAGGGPNRSPDEQQLNLQLRLRAQRLVGVDLDFYGEAIHILAPGPGTIDDTSFVATSDRQTLWRIGAAFRY
jgi:hypothetical protein